MAADLPQVSPQCVADLQDVVKLVLSLNTGKTKTSTYTADRQGTLAQALVSAAICLHLDDDPDQPFACTVCIDYRRRQQYPIGSSYHPIRLPSVVHRAAALNRTAAWLFKSVDTHAWCGSDEMGPWKVKRAALLEMMAPRNTLARILEHTIAMALETDKERQERPMHYVAASSLLMGYCACSAFVPNGLVVPTTASDFSSKRRMKKASDTTMSAARKDHYATMWEKKAHGRGRHERIRRYTARCSALKDLMFVKLQAPPPGGAAGPVDDEDQLAKATQLPTLTVIQALLNRDEALCRVLIACCSFLAVAFAGSVGAESVWNAAKQKGRNLEPTEKRDAELVSEMVRMLLAPNASDPEAGNADDFPPPPPMSVFDIDGCAAKATYEKPSTLVTSVGFLKHAALKHDTVVRINNVLCYMDRIAWSLVFPMFVSSIVTIMHDYVVDRFSKGLRAGTQDHQTGMRAVVDSAMADRGVYFQQVIRCRAHGGVDVDERLASEFDATLHTQGNDPFADISAVLRTAFTSLAGQLVDEEGTHM